MRLIVPCKRDEQSAIDALAARGIVVEPAWTSGGNRWREGARAAIAGACGQPYVMYRRHVHSTVRRRLLKLLHAHKPNLLYLDHLDSAAYCRWLPKVPKVVDLHNVYSTLASRTANEEPRFLFRAYLTREARLLERAEADAVQQTELAFSVSPQERDYFETLGGAKVAVVPNGVDCEAYDHLPVGRYGGMPTVLYVGPMSYRPNAAAAEFLAGQVMPAVRKKIPDARLRIVGRDPPPDVRRLASAPGVEVAGSVADMIPELSKAHLLAVPLESGGGTRLKILEAFAAGLPVVSTHVGCEGLEVVDRKHLLVEARPRFADVICDLLRDGALGVRTAQTARYLVQEQYDWKIVGGHAVAAILSLIGEGRSPTEIGTSGLWPRSVSGCGA